MEKKEKTLTAEDLKISTINKLKNQYALSPEEHAQLRALIDKILDQQIDELRKEVEQLRDWKKQMTQVWDPIYIFMQKDPSVKLGELISKEVLNRLNKLIEFNKLSQEMAYLIKKLRQRYSDKLPDWFIVNADENLTTYNNLIK